MDCMRNAVRQPVEMLLLARLSEKAEEAVLLDFAD